MFLLQGGMVRLPDGRVITKEQAEAMGIQPINTAGTPVGVEPPVGPAGTASITPVGAPVKRTGEHPLYGPNPENAPARTAPAPTANAPFQRRGEHPLYGPNPEDMPARTPAPVDNDSLDLLGLLAGKQQKPQMNQADVLMAIGSGMLGLSGDPNLQKMGMAGFGQVAARRDERKATAKTNATVDTLVAAGVIPAAQADALRNNPELIGEVYKSALKGNVPLSDIGKLAADLKAGRITQAQYDAKVAAIGKPLVQIGQGEQWTELGNKFIFEDMNPLVTQGRNATRGMILLDDLEAALAESPTGTWGGLTAWAQNNLGISIDPNADATVAANAIISKLIPEQRQAGSGPMSDRDIDLFRASLPSLLNTPEGNARIIATMRKMYEYDAQMGQIARRVLLDPKFTPEMGDEAMRKLANPLEWVRKKDEQDERRKQFKVLPIGS